MNLPTYNPIIRLLRAEQIERQVWNLHRVLLRKGYSAEYRFFRTAQYKEQLYKENKLTSPQKAPVEGEDSTGAAKGE